MAEVCRPLSTVERWYWFCDQISALNVISRVQVRGELGIAALRGGLNLLQARHPLLRARIEHEDGVNPNWVTCDRPIPLREVRREREDQWVHEVNEHELGEQVDPDTGPLIRAVAVIGNDKVYDLLLVLPHIICDGTTALSLAEQWLTLATDSGAPQWTGRILASAEEMRPSRFTGDEGVARLAQQTTSDKELWDRCKPGRVKPSASIPFAERQARLIHRELSGDQLDAIASASRSYGTTVHGALTAALVLAAARDDDAGRTHFAIGSPVNFREELNPSVRPDEVGTYVATIPTVVNVTMPFWDVAREITTQLTERKIRGDHFNLVNLVMGAVPQSITDFHPFMETMEAEGPINLVSSNIGRHPFPDRIDGLEVSNAQFLAGISVLGYFVATINSSHGRTFWNFTHIDKAFPANRAESLVDDCLETLLSAIDERAKTKLQGAEHV